MLRWFSRKLLKILKTISVVGFLYFRIFISWFFEIAYSENEDFRKSMICKMENKKICSSNLFLILPTRSTNSAEYFKKVLWAFAGSVFRFLYIKISIISVPIYWYLGFFGFSMRNYKKLTAYMFIQINTVVEMGL